MPKVTKVLKARKAIPQYKIEVGDTYYHWAFMVGGRGGPKICSKTPPTRAQLTRSEYFGAVYAIFDGDLANLEPEGAVEALRDAATAIEELGSEQQEKYDNMPDSLQQGDTGQTLEARASSCESVKDALNEAADELETKLEELDKEEEDYKALVQKWEDYDTAVADYDEDSDDPEPEEPDEDRPDDRDFDQERQEAVDEAMQGIDEPE